MSKVDNRISVSRVGPRGLGLDWWGGLRNELEKGAREVAEDFKRETITLM